MSGYETVIGLEVHAQLMTETKLFCGCRARFGDPPNTNVCPVCLGLPGALPVLNRRAVELAARMGFAVGCRVNEISVFARKNYFYPDLPKGYQISQYDRPLAFGGGVTIDLDGSAKTIGIHRIHMEEDAGKLLHEGFRDAETKSGVDFNRSGVPLIEIVSEPELRSPEEAVAYAQALKVILEFTDVSDADMEKGNLRCDGNISLRRQGETELGTKVELKNLNSFRFLGRALAFEAERQAAALEAGETIVQETRLFDADRGRTETMRTKEEAHDYRYFPEPDLPPLVLEQKWLGRVRDELPELPEARRSRLVSEYGIPAYDAGVLTSSRPLADYFEAAAATSANAKAASNWIMSEVLRKVNETSTPIEAVPVTAASLGELVRLIDEGAISGKIAKEVFEKMYASGEAPRAIVEREGLAQLSDEAEIEKLAQQIVSDNPSQAEEYRGGNDKVLGWFVGQLMKATSGKANPKLARDALTKVLG